ncbi:hypothetical protein DPMN_135997 [Dreissena polymorpha]|uniref:Myb/SANT-like DNA-binding domain-containing protein n=1 Tax=Dreissena polymorpha TaxID=45954 RepID=A0A9D4JF57_DREPO|nr:hypothetical protein DPMN_135997 [Dreissena polymorpha]
MDVKTKKKKTNWSKNEFETLVSEYENKFDVLEGDLSVSLTGSDKRKAWEIVMEWTRPTHDAQRTPDDARYDTRTMNPMSGARWAITVRCSSDLFSISTRFLPGPDEPIDSEAQTHNIQTYITNAGRWEKLGQQTNAEDGKNWGNVQSKRRDGENWGNKDWTNWDYVIQTYITNAERWEKLGHKDEKNWGHVIDKTQRYITNAEIWEKLGPRSRQDT